MCIRDSYSSDNQRDASIEDQLRVCRVYAERQGWTIVDSYSDRAQSGASLLRPGVQALIADACRGRFQIVLAEALDRLSRDQEDVAGLFKRMAFAGVKIVTLSEGEIGQLHVGLKGTMNALFLKDLADKTRRGLQGRVEEGKSGGGNAYGYDVVKQFDSRTGEAIRGDRRINEWEADIIRRIFRNYASGKSSRAIAFELNEQGISGPFGRAWGPSTIHGSTKRRNGILNNELYIGKLVWNRQRFIKDPDTGKRVSRLNPESEWVTQEAPELRIVDDELWQRVKDRQQSMSLTVAKRDDNPMLTSRRPRYLFSGLIKCGVCGGGCMMISKTLIGCSTARNKGTCNNRLNIRRELLEASVLDGLRHSLMEPELFAEFCDAFTREVNRNRMGESASLAAHKGELVKIERQIRTIIEAIKDGLYQPSMKAEMAALEYRKAELTNYIANTQEPKTLLHPNMALLYRKKVEELHIALSEEETRAEAAEIVRSLVDAIQLLPNDGKLSIYLKGDLAGILTLAANKRKQGQNTALSQLEQAQVSLVAGAGFEPAAFRL